MLHVSLLNWNVKQKNVITILKQIPNQINTWPKILEPLVNMTKEVSENESALLILLIFYLINAQKSNLSLDNKRLKWGKYHYEINVFL